MHNCAQVWSRKNPNSPSSPPVTTWSHSDRAESLCRWQIKSNSRREEVVVVLAVLAYALEYFSWRWWILPPRDLEPPLSATYSSIGLRGLQYIFSVIEMHSRTRDIHYISTNNWSIWLSWYRLSGQWHFLTHGFQGMNKHTLPLTQAPRSTSPHSPEFLHCIRGTDPPAHSQEQALLLYLQSSRNPEMESDPVSVIPWRCSALERSHVIEKSTRFGIRVLTLSTLFPTSIFTQSRLVEYSSTSLAHTSDKFVNVSLRVTS